MDGKIITRKDVAELSGVSVATVSNVFSGKVAVSEEVQGRVRDAARRLKYVPNHTARSLSLGRSNHIGIAINESTNPFHMEIVKYVEDVALSAGFLVSTFEMLGSFKNKAAAIEKCSLDALVNFTTALFYDEFFDILKSQNTVMVNFGLDKGMSFGHEDVDAMKECMHKLAQMGHKNVGYVSALDKSVFVKDERGSTFMANREAVGFTVNDDYIQSSDGSAFKSVEYGYKGTEMLMKRHPEITALFVTNDMGALGAIRALKDMGYACPDDVSVIGCDDIEISRLCVPSISTMGFDKEAYGKKMAQKTIECILNHESGIGYDFKVKSYACFRESVAVCRDCK